MGKVLFIFLCVLLGARSFADVLFIDMNDNPAEIKAAERAAKKRGEKLIVLGAPTAEVRKKVEPFKAGQAALRAEYAKKDLSPERRQQLQMEYQKLGEEIRKVSPMLDKEALSTELKKLKRENVNLSSLVISGHDGNGNFGGMYGKLTAEDFRTSFAENAPLGENVRSLILAGCYTGNLGAVETNWKMMVPNLNVIAGYDNKAPLGDKKAGHDYIEQVLTKEKKLTEAKDKRSLEKSFKGLKNVGLIDASICVNGQIVNKEGAKDIADLDKLCEELGDGKKVTAWTERIQCFLQGAAGCEKPPDDTSRGELRQIYNEIQKVKHCEASLAKKQIMFPSTDVLIRLILYKDVAKNIAQNHSDWLRDYDKSLKELGFPDDELLGDVRNLSRTDLAKKMEKIRNRLGAIASDTKFMAGAGGEKLATAAYNMGMIDNTILQLNPVCAPFGWVEPNDHSTSPCMAAPQKDVISDYAAKYYINAVYSQVATKAAIGAKTQEEMSRSAYSLLLNEREKAKEIPGFKGSAQEKVLNEYIESTKKYNKAPTSKIDDQ